MISIGRLTIFSPLANWVNDACLPVAMLILTDVMMIIIPIIAWKCFIKRPLSEMGLHPFKSTKKECGAGMILGMVNCTLVFLLVVWFGGGKVASWQPRITAFNFNVVIRLYIGSLCRGSC